MFPNFTYHLDLTKLHVGCEPAAAYLIPYQNQEAAHTGERGASQRFLSLCGEWDFHYYRSSAELEDFTAAEWNPAGSRKITVPMSWQMALDQGYDKPQYVNVTYPFPVDPPHLPDENPCGLYERDFYLTRELLDTCSVELVFEGVDSCFYVFLNGQFAAYSQGSHATTKIRLDGNLCEGRNHIQVLVFKWCDGSYLEDQDKIRLSGIFREVYLLLRAPVHLTDLYIRPQENMAHNETRWVEIRNAGEHGLRALADAGRSFSFNCSHYTAARLTETAHDHELLPLPQTVVCLDYAQSGIGSNSCGPELEESLRLQEEEFRFAIRLCAV